MVRYSVVKVFNHFINVWNRQRAVFPLYIALSHRLRHAVLTHVAANHSIAAVHILFDGCKNLFEVFRASAKACRAEQEDVLAF